MKTFLPSVRDIKRQWYVIDAKGLPLGRVATRVAHHLRGKHKPAYTPHIDQGDGVIVLNAQDVVLTGKKWDLKNIFSYSGYIGNVRKKTARKVHDEKPTFLLKKAILGMLPRTRFKKDIEQRLKIYPDSEHPHVGQNPISLTL